MAAILGTSFSSATYVYFPIGQALAATGQENADGIVGADDTLTELEKTVNEFHRFYVRHRAQNRPTKPLAGRERFSAAGLRLKRLGHAELQRYRRQLPR